MRPLTIKEIEVALAVELYIGGIFAVLLPLGMARFGPVFAANARQIWTEWKLENDRRAKQVELIMKEFKQELKRTSGPNRVRELKRRRERAQLGIPEGKRRYVRFDHARALACVRKDWFADLPNIPRPKFSDVDFQQTFGVTRTIVEEIVLPACCRHRPDIFSVSKDAAKRPGIRPIVKVLNALKVARFGVSMTCFKDYFQMGENTARQAFHALMDTMANDVSICSKYRRAMNRSDLERVMAMHREQHGVDGIAFSIDCWHLNWKNCPSAWKGQLEGKEGVATLVMEAGCDYNLWFWHTAFGYPGTMNDIQIWEQSELYNSISSGEWAQFVDPIVPFRIGSMETNQAFFLVDGIYPLLSRFCKTISEPQNKDQERFTAWQEAVRKDSERGFGVLGSKFRALIRPVEFRQPKDIANLVYGCVSLHNMMVEYRMTVEEMESADIYSISNSLNERIHEKTNVWIQQQAPVDAEATNDNQSAFDSLLGEEDQAAANDNQEAKAAAAEFDPWEYLVHGSNGTAIIQSMHADLIGETSLGDARRHYKLQRAIVEELALGAKSRADRTI